MTAVAAPPDRIRLAGQREEVVIVAHLRLMVMMLLFLFAALAIAAKIVWMAVSTDPSANRALSDGLTPSRADLVDRNGVPLARMIKGWAIGVHPREVMGDRRVLARKLAELMPEHSEAWYLKTLVSGRKYAYLQRRARPELVRAVNAIGEPAIQLTREPERLYPQGTLAAHVLGWVDEDGVAASGMEYSIDDRLTDPARLAEPVALSLDSRVQAAVETEMNAAIVKHSAVAASAIVLDVNTGEIVAMTSMPTFNPNASLADRPYKNEMNQATGAVFELGSTFKPITIANAIETGVAVSMTKRYDATAPLRVGGYTIRDDHPQKRYLNIPETLVHSSNIVTSRIGEELGRQRIEAMFRKLGFDAPAEIEINARAKPIWPTYWARTTVMTVGYGHGIAVTPLHLANAYAALVNGGIWRPATLLKRDPARVPRGRRVISAATSTQMRHLLRLIVTDGTGGKADAPGFRVGGKTGTADKASAGGYAHNARVSTFAAVFPMDAPRYVVIAMLDDPKGTADTGGYATAGMVSAPVVGRVVARIGPLLGIYPEEKPEPEVDALRSLLWKPRKKVD